MQIIEVGYVPNSIHHASQFLHGCMYALYRALTAWRCKVELLSLGVFQLICDHEPIAAELLGHVRQVRCEEFPEGLHSHEDPVIHPKT